MFKIIIISIIISIGTLSGKSQSSLTINVERPSTIQLIKLPDSTRHTKSVTAQVIFPVRPNTSYYIIISSAGFKTYNEVVNIKDSDLVLNILQEPKTNLQNVTVIARKPLVTQEEDKTIVDAEPLSQSSTNAYEVLEKIPGAIVDQDGNVYLNSATPATIQINGREVKISTADLASLLKSLPANSVLKIEILRNPSAKYDAGSSGGILNIVLKKGIKLGTNGSANVGYFQGKYATVTAGFNLNKSNSKFQSYLSYQYTNRKYFQQINSNRFIQRDTSVVMQDAYTIYPTYNHYLGGGTSWQVNKKLSLDYDLRVSYNKNNSDALNAVDVVKEKSGSVLNRSISSILNDETTLFVANSLSSKLKLDTLGSEWTTDFDLSFHHNENQQDYSINPYQPVNDIINGTGISLNRKTNFTGQTDLVYKFKNHFTIETGIKFSYALSRNNADYIIQRGSQPAVADSFQTNHFRYTESISSVYLQVAKDLAGFTIKPGLRMETTDINGHQLFPADNTLQLKRTDFFPYVYLRHKLIKMFGFQLVGNLIYRKSITRPYYEVLNPYPKFIDQYLFDVGNPNLKPQFTTNYEFNIMADQYPVFSAGLNDTKNIFTNVTYQDQVTRIAYRTYDNLGSNKEFYLRLIAGIPPGKTYFFYAGAQRNLNHYTGFYQSQPIDYTWGSWLFFMYHNYKPWPDFNISLHGFMRVKGFQNFYELKNFGALNMSFNKTILNKKANLILAFNDMLNTAKVNFSLNQAGISAEGTRFVDTRKVGLTFRYNFGIKPKEEKKPNFEAPNE